ncbi:E3 ubiquitin-protein ligase RNF180 isoform X1 [Lacerta agilis]|uniref:E3 ubiquitin-protein ligase RNF180 isoform X1 n=1 Tax=Lacerta agilis TaxID=80427 RepID=UPI001419ADDE|nr:E3 ubiquitin-protein ligase RNF180 isoform X1 [Lacerta agilis]
MNSQGQGDMLRCWKCRKYVANSDCLINDQTTDLVFEEPHSSTASQDICNVWHMNIEALPDWVTRIIENAQWTTGKLNCPFCGARLGGFNFVNNTKCSCGQFTNIHLCKRRTDYQTVSSVTSAISPLKHLSLCKVHSDFNNEIWQSVTGGSLEDRNQRLPYVAKNNSGIGRLMEALCLEVRSTNFEMNSKKIHFKVSNPKTSISASLAVNDKYTVKAFHRKSQSLDMNFREKLVLLPTLYGTSTAKRPVFSRQHEAQPFYTKGCLQLKSSRTHNFFHFPLKSDACELPNNFSVTSYGAFAQEETEFNHGLKVSKQYLESTAADQQLFLSSSESTTEEDTVQKHITPLGLLQPFTTIDQRLSKRKRNQLNSLRRKKRWPERWPQKQILLPARLWSRSKVSTKAQELSNYKSQAMNTEEEHEHWQDKESYLCAVCLDVYFNPYMCYPCHHIFCEPCLRTLAKDNPTSTLCPLCRTAIAQVFFQPELNNSTKAHFPIEYSKLKENFQESGLAKWPLPSCRKAFRVIEGFQNTDSFTRRHFPHAAHRMDYMDFEDDSRGLRFDMDMVIIYIYSINWVIGFIVFCFLCYFFFPF